VRAGAETADRQQPGGGMKIQDFFQPPGDANVTPILRWLRHVQQGLSRIGNDDHRGETELCRLSGLPSCCFAHFVDKQK
jgi:hypothetical protein